MAAGIHEVPGYDSEVGERGVQHFPKDRNRGCPSPARSSKSRTSNDQTCGLEVERSIFEALPAMVRDKTLFVVAHRLSTVQNSDRILLLNEQRLVGGGRPSILAGEQLLPGHGGEPTDF